MRGRPAVLPPELPEYSIGARHAGKLVLPTPEITEWFQLRLNIKPQPKARPRARAKKVGKDKWVGEIYTPADSALYEHYIRLLALMSEIWYVSSGPVGLIQWFSFKRPKRLEGAKHPSGPIWRPHEPDDDNLEKAVWDALNGVAWKSDGQVTFHQCYDVYSPKGEGSFVDLCFFAMDGAENTELVHRSKMIEDTILGIHQHKKTIEREAKKKNAAKKTSSF